MDRAELSRVVAAVRTMQLQHVVVTSVDRDDLSDGGAEIFSEEINAIRQQVPTYQMEVLIPDFQANWEALATVVKQAPEILDRNVETARRLTPVVRAKAQYDRSPTVLKKTKSLRHQQRTKSSIMVDLGKT